jgi:hypothetical protein
VRFTCDKCHGDYQAHEGSAVAHLYVKDPRCNHLEARCTHCGTTEVIFLGPHRIEEAIREGELEVEVSAQAAGELRVRAERAWHAAESGTPPERRGNASAPAGTQLGSPRTELVEGDTLRRYELTDRHEELLASFGSALENIPDDLLWDGLHSEHHPLHPERWTD